MKDWKVYLDQITTLVLAWICFGRIEGPGIFWRFLVFSEGSLSDYFWNTFSIFMALRGRKRSTQLQQCHRKAAAAAGCLSFKEFWGVQFEKGCFLFRLQRVFGQWRNSWGASLPAIYILHPLCEAQTFNGTFPQLEIYCAAACLLVHNRAKPFWKVSLSSLSSCQTSGASRNLDRLGLDLGIGCNFGVTWSFCYFLFLIIFWIISWQFFFNKSFVEFVWRIFRQFFDNFFDLSFYM